MPLSLCARLRSRPSLDLASVCMIVWLCLWAYQDYGRSNRKHGLAIGNSLQRNRSFASSYR